MSSRHTKWQVEIQHTECIAKDKWKSNCSPTFFKLHVEIQYVAVMLWIAGGNAARSRHFEQDTWKSNPQPTHIQR